MATFRKGVRAIQLVGRASEFSNKNVSYTLFIAKKLIHTKCIKNKVHFHTNTNSANYEWKMKANIWMYFISSSNVPLVLYIFFILCKEMSILLPYYSAINVIACYFHTVCVIKLWHTLYHVWISLRSQLYFLVLCTKNQQHTFWFHTHFFGISNITTCIVLRQSFFFERDLLKSMCNYISLVKVIFILSQPKL